MKAVVLNGGFGVDRVSLGEVKERAPQRGEVKLRVSAMSINYRDFAIVMGFYNAQQRMPLILGSDCVGEVTEIGAGVTRVKVGERVSPIFAQKWLAGDPTPEMMTHSQLGSSIQGVMSEYVVLDEEGVVSVPSHLGDLEAATLPCAGVTAWQCVSTVGRCKPGDWVLIQGTGGVSSLSLAFAKMLGAKTIVLTSTPERAEQSIKDGANAVVNYREHPAWSENVMSLTGGRGANLVIDVAGGDGVDQSIRSACNGGVVALVGFLTGNRSVVDVRQLLRRRLRMEAISVGSREMFEEMNRAIASSGWTPRYAASYDVADVRAALEAQGAGRHAGKITLKATW